MSILCREGTDAHSFGQLKICEKRIFYERIDISKNQSISDYQSYTKKGGIKN